MIVIVYSLVDKMIFFNLAISPNFFSFCSIYYKKWEEHLCNLSPMGLRMFS